MKSQYSIVTEVNETTLISSSGGWLNNGKKANSHATIRYAKPIILTGRPHLPRLHLLSNSGCLSIRFHRIQLMEMMYDDNMETMPIERIALKATLLPRLIRERREATVKMTKVALSGMS